MSKTLSFGPPAVGWPDFPKKPTVYLAGPMRGILNFNFPAFDKGAAVLRAAGWAVLSPAEHDRESGFDETLNELGDFDLKQAFKWDVAAILQADAIALLPGWEKSTGVCGAELPVARTLGLTVIEFNKKIKGYHTLSVKTLESRIGRLGENPLVAWAEGHLAGLIEFNCD